MESVWGNIVKEYVVTGVTYNGVSGKLRCTVYTHNITIEFINNQNVATLLNGNNDVLVDNKYIMSKQTQQITAGKLIDVEGSKRFAFFVCTADIISGLSYTSNSSQSAKDPYTSDLSTCFKVYIIEKESNCEIYSQGIDLDMSSFTKGYMSFFIPGMYPEYEKGTTDADIKRRFYNCLILEIIDNNYYKFTITHAALEKTFYLIRWWGLDWFQPSETVFNITNDEVRFQTKKTLVKENGEKEEKWVDDDGYRNLETYVIAPYRWILKELQEKVDDYNNEYAHFERRVQQLDEVVGNISYNETDTINIDTNLNFSMIPPVKYSTLYKEYKRRLDDGYEIQVRFVEGEDVDSEFVDILSKSMCDDFSKVVLNNTKNIEKDYNVSFSDNVNGYINSETFAKLITNKKNFSISGTSISIILSNIDLKISGNIILNSQINVSLIGNSVLRTNSIIFNNGTMRFYSYSEVLNEIPHLSIQTVENFTTNGNIMYLDPFVRLDFITDNPSRTCDLVVNLSGKTNINPLIDKSRITVSNFDTLNFNCNVERDVSSPKILTTDKVKTVNIVRYVRDTYSRRSGTDIVIQKFNYVGLRGIVYTIPKERDVDSKFEEGYIVRLLNGFTASELDIVKCEINNISNLKYTFLDIVGCKDLKFNSRKISSKDINLFKYNKNTSFRQISLDKSDVNVDGLFSCNSHDLRVFNNSNLYFKENVDVVNIKDIYFTDCMINFKKDLRLIGDLISFKLLRTNLSAENFTISSDYISSNIFIDDSTLSISNNLSFEGSRVEVTNSYLSGKKFNYKSNSARIFGTIKVGYGNKITETFSCGSIRYNPYYLPYNESKTITSTVNVSLGNNVTPFFEYIPEGDVSIINTIDIANGIKSIVKSDLIKEAVVTYSPNSEDSHVLELSDEAELTVSFPTKCSTSSYGKNKYKISRKKDFDYDNR